MMGDGSHTPDIVPFDQTPARTSERRRKLTLAALRLNGKSDPMGGAVWITKWFVVKYGPRYRMEEAETMHFVSSHTLIPVPKIYSAFIHKGHSYLVMERAKGRRLYMVWHKMTRAQQDSAIEHLRGYLDQIRRLTPPRPGQVGSLNYKPLSDERIRMENFGPFETIQDFHKFIGTEYVLNAALEAPDSAPAQDVEIAQKMKTRSWKTRFSHCDLNPLNIMVHKGHITALLDWERSGWLPEYYEYANAWHQNFYDLFWRPEVLQCLEEYAEELYMDRMRRYEFQTI